MTLKSFVVLTSVAIANALAVIPRDDCSTEQPHEGIRAIAAQVNAARHNSAASAEMESLVAASIEIPVYVHVLAADKTAAGGYLSVRTVTLAL